MRSLLAKFGVDRTKVGYKTARCMRLEDNSITGIDRCPAGTAPPHRIVTDAENRAKLGMTMATVVSCYSAKFQEDRTTGSQTATSTRWH